MEYTNLASMQEALFINAKLFTRDEVLNYIARAVLQIAMELRELNDRELERNSGMNERYNNG